jgi:NAD(P)-dependent dehydrogenase (short-subunit alcohol dehydrogenase family)
MKQDELKGRVALITGAAGAGIGGATARRLSAGGAAIAVVDVHERRTQETTDALTAAGVTALAVPLDITDRDAVDKAIVAITRELGPVDILVNNAAVNTLSTVVEMNPEDWDRGIDVDLTAPWYMIRAVLPSMIERRQGWIVNVTSVAGYLHAATEGPYAAAKAALHSLTRAVAHESGPMGVRCNAVAPGIIMSKFVAKHEERLRPQIERTPLRRFGQPEDVADVIAFLVSDDSRFITGETIAITGGWYMRP